ncbi:MAG: peptide-binding protein [Rhodobacterales bacterium]|nr:MAG: peptide-binding protein [Rhodobacterales bacterium]
MKFLFVLILSLLPGLAFAQGFPATHNVVGVAADDVLNIRPTPGTSGAPIGALAPDAVGVEVIRVTPDGRWGLVNVPGGSGWVSMRFMTRDGQHQGFPAPASCSGTEPFWSLTLERSGTVTFTPMDGVPTVFTTQKRLTAIGMLGRYGLVARSAQGALHATISQSACNDGMSEMEYGLTVDAIIRDADGYHLWSGCCALTR